MTRPLPESQPRLWGACACGAALAALYQFFGNASRGYIDTDSLFYWWGYQWTNPASEAEHGWLILGLSGWLFVRNLRARDESAGEAHERPLQTAADPVGPALAAMLAGLALHAVGFVAQQTRVSIVGFLFCLWGVLRLAGGRRWGAAAAFPVAFLVFAIPVNMLDSVGFWLRVWVVDASAAIAKLAGIGVLQSGTQLVSPDGAYNYDVAAACSGIRLLTAMVVLSLLAGYLNFRTWWRRGLILLLSLPLVYLGNVARIVAIVSAAEAGGTKWGDVAHEVMGYGIFVIVLGGVLAAAALLRRWRPERAEKCHLLNDTYVTTTSETKGKCHLLNDTSGWRAAVVVVGVLAVGEMVFLQHIRSLPARGAAGVVLADDGANPVELPAFVGTEWIARRAEVTAVERAILPADTGYSRKVYVNLGSRREVLLSIVLSGRDRSSIHRPELCLVGQGWTINDGRRHVFRRSEQADQAFEATVLRVEREVQTPRGKVVIPQLAAYWFVGGDAIVPTHWQRIARDSWNRVVHARADRWAYVFMQTDAVDGEAAAFSRLQAVLEGTLPAFQPAAPSP